MMDHFALVVLSGILLLREIHWARLTNKLIDKLMSRNYHEYKQAEGQGEPLTARPTPSRGPEDRDIDVMRDFQPL